MTLRKMILSMRAVAMTALTAVMTMTSLVPVEGRAQTPAATPVCTLTVGGTTTEYFLQADGGTYEDAKSALLQAVSDIYGKDSPELTLFKDIDLDGETAHFNGFTDTFILDLNGCTIQSTISPIDLNSGCEMIIYDWSSGTPGQVVCTGVGYSIENNGKLTLNAGAYGKINNNSGADLTISVATVTGEETAINNSGEIVLNPGATVTANTTAIENSGLITVNSGGSVTAEGTAINNSGELTLNSGSTVTANNTAIINSKNLSVNEGATVIAGNIAIDNTGNLYVQYGTTVTATGDGGYAIYSSGSASDFAISGGTITASGSGGTGIFVDGTFYLNGWPTFGSGTPKNACDIAFAGRFSATFSYGIEDKPARPITVQHMTLNSETGAYVVDDNLQEPFAFATSYGTYVKYSSGDQKDEVIPLAEVFCLATDKQEITLSEDKGFAAFVPTDLTKYQFDAIADRTYDGTAQEPAVGVYYADNGGTYYITDGLDFAYANNTNAYHSSYTDTSDPALAPTVTIRSKTDRNFTGDVSKTFQIAPKVAEIAWSNTALTYNGSAQLPTATVSNLCEGDQCTVYVDVISSPFIDIYDEDGNLLAIYSGAYTASVYDYNNTNYRFADVGVAEEATALASLTHDFTISPATAENTPYLAWDESAGALAMTSHDAQVLEGWETTLGTAGQETFYLASGTLNYKKSDPNSNIFRLNTKGDVHLILGDRADMQIIGDLSAVTAFNETTNQIVNGNLFIHAQSAATSNDCGKLSVNNLKDNPTDAISSVGNITIDGGVIEAKVTGNTDAVVTGIYCLGDLAIHGGTIEATAKNTGTGYSDGISAKGDIAILGGNVTATSESKGSTICYGINASNGNLYVNGATVTVNCTNTDTGLCDAIYASNGFTFTDATVHTTATASFGTAYGIYGDGDITINGGETIAHGTSNGNGDGAGISVVGKLTLDHANVTATGYSKSAEQSYGISATSDLTIDGGVINASAESGGDNVSYGIWSTGAITIDDADVTASGTSKGSGESNGIYAKNGLTIDKGKVTATALTEGNADSFGIYTVGAITSTSATVTASGKTDGVGSSFGIFASNGLTIDKGNVTATGTNKDSGEGKGIYCENDITATYADITAIGNNTGSSPTFGIDILDGNLTATGCTLTAKGLTTLDNSNSSYGISCNVGNAAGKGNVTIEGGKITAEGNDYCIKSFGDGAAITLDWLETSDFISASHYYGTVKIPAGRYFANFDVQGSVDMIYGNAATAGDYTFGGTYVNIYGDETLHPVSMIPTNPDGGTGEQYIGYSEQDGDMAIVGGTAQSYAIVGYDFSTSPAVVYTVPVNGIAKGGALVLGPAGAATALPDEVGVVVMSGSSATAIENSYAGESPLRNFIAAPADGVTTLDQQIAQTLGTGTPGQPDYVPASPADYIVFMIAGGSFRPVSRTATSVLPANTAVLAVSKIDMLTRSAVGTKPSAARRITLSDSDGGTTGINSMDNGKWTMENGEWYTIDGRKMSQAPKAKGIYIHNGTKYVVR